MLDICLSTTLQNELHEFRSSLLRHDECSLIWNEFQNVISSNKTFSNSCNQYTVWFRQETAKARSLVSFFTFQTAICSLVSFKNRTLMLVRSIWKSNRCFPLGLHLRGKNITVLCKWHEYYQHLLGMVRVENGSNTFIWAARLARFFNK
jgi:hypothetical protein